ncbi:diacylglycerol kinase family lipid kinase [Oenococcus alcoholitolerans]|uniref:diacylglycerol kinase family lipid kinase n=1 Tax=Oenococcus alcoholitolerans TaxID=931074 RepID=UPI003F6F8146
MKRARIIYNPSSGRETIQRVMLEIMEVYEKAGFETSVFETTKKAFSARDEARRAALDGFDLIVAAGGDGTVNEVVNGISGLEKRPLMAVIPAGTTNDYARALKIPRDDLIEAAKVINKKETIKMDIGKVTSHNSRLDYFMNIGAIGTLSELTYEVPSMLKTLYGYLAYLTKGAELITRIKPVPVRIEYDEGFFEGKANLILLALTNSVGGFEKIVPDARLDDGKFTLLIVKQSNIVQLFNLITKALNDGSHIKDKLVTYVKSSKVRVLPLSKEKMKVNLDGEFGGIAPMSFENLRQHLEFVAFTSKMKPHSRTMAQTADEVMLKRAEEEYRSASKEMKKNHKVNK